MLLTGHKSRAIFDRYNIINEQELLDAGDQLVAYLAQHAQGCQPVGGPTRPAPPPRAPHRPSALLHESSRARTMPTDRILTGRCDTTLVGRGRSSDSRSHSRRRPHSPAQLDSGREGHRR